MPSLSFSATDTMSASAGTNNVIAFTFEGDNVVAAADAFKVVVQGLIPSAVGPIWSATPGMSLVTLMLSNTTGVPVTTIKLFKNGTGPTNQIGPTFNMPALGGAFITASSFLVVDANGAVVQSSATSSAKNYAARVYARATFR